MIVPTLNEARNLEAVVPELSRDYELVLVDGGSVDDTVATALRLRPDCRVVQQTGRGKGNALLCGFAAASGDIVVTLDADGSADPHEIPRFVAALVAGADYAKGSRFATSEGRRGGSTDLTVLRMLGNGGLSVTSNVLFGTRFSDLCYGYNAFWRDVLPALELPDPGTARPDRMLWGDGFEIETLLSCRAVVAGLRIAEVPSVERERIFGTSNLRTFTDGARVLRTLLVEFRLARARRLRGPSPALPHPRIPAAHPTAAPAPARSVAS